MSTIRKTIIRILLLVATMLEGNDKYRNEINAITNTIYLYEKETTQD